MAIKKKGTPEKIKIVKETDLEKWKKYINELVNNAPFVITTENKPKNKKGNK